jgi:hypothetical protein
MRRRVVVLAVILALGFIMTRSIMVFGKAAGEGCGAAEPVEESSKFTPFMSRLSQRPLPAILSTGGVPLDPTAPLNVDGLDYVLFPAPEQLKGASLQLALADSQVSAISLYFVGRPVSSGDTLATFWDAGGIFVHESPWTNSYSRAEELAVALGDRAVTVKVGEHDAALVYADPIELDVRTHNIAWSDGVEQFEIRAVLTPEEIVDLARSMVCGS